MPTRLHALDLGIVALYLVAITLFGLRFSRKNKTADKSLRGYFLANKTIPWWAIALSIVSAETSTLTIISIPGVAFAGNFGFLQIVFGYMLGRIVVALLFLPKYFQGEMLTAYQLIDRRFGHTLHKVTAALFLLTRAAAEGVRVFAVSIVVGIAIGTRDVLSIAIISALTLLYTFEGGMAAVIWTDVVQMAIYIGGTFVAIWTLGAHVPGGWGHIHAVAGAAGKFHLLNFALNLTQTYTFWAGVLGGTFLTMASHGTDQLMVQRMLAAKNLRQSQLALLSSGVVILLQFTLFLLIGAGLFVFYGPSGPWALNPGPSSPDRIFPTFIVSQMPIGIAGLLVAAILAAAMSNLSAALNSLASTTVVDFYMGWRPGAADRERIFISRGATVLWALILFAMAVYSIHVGGKGHVVELGLSIASVAYGCLLGVFLLGTLTKYATQTGAIIGMVVGFALNLTLWLQSIHTLPNPIAGIRFPAVAFTWYVLIGAAVTFTIGSLASLLFRKQSSRAVPAMIALPLLAVILSGAMAPSAIAQSASTYPNAASRYPKASALGLSASTNDPGLQPLGHALASDASQPQTTTPDFTPVSAAIDQAIAEKKLPGAVLAVGHNGKLVFEQVYGLRKLANEPGLDGKPSPAEPMTEDTIFDMASLTKNLATATAIMQLMEQGKVDADAPVAKYLPEFAANGKQNVTIRDLLTHYSGLPPDVDLKDPWGLAKPDKAEGIRRAMESKLDSEPGTKFVYSDINFITLGALVEKLSGQPLDEYAQQHIFAPLKMTHTRYLPLNKPCGDRVMIGAAIALPPPPPPPTDGRLQGITVSCNQDQWMVYQWVSQIAPTQHDDQGTAETNPFFDHLLRGTVHDPTTRRMGGVAGHAGVFSTANDVALFAQALLDRLAGRPSNFPLKRETLQLMTTPQQPKTALSNATIFTADGKSTTPDGKPNTGVALRGFGWDINSAYSRPRGEIFPTAGAAVPASFGHTGFTGTCLWMDPGSDTYVILLSNAVHPRGNPTTSPLRGQVATLVAKALGLSSSTPSAAVEPGGPSFAPLAKGGVSSDARLPSPDPSPTLTGIDVLESTNFDALKDAAARHEGHLRIGLLTNQTGLDAQGRRTIDILHSLTTENVQLTTLFSPEHGIFGAKDSTTIGPEFDPATGLKVISLYGAKDADRRPKPEDLQNLDAIVIDLQDAGVRFYTYETVVGYFLEASACQTAARHDLEVIVLDRPNPIGGVSVQGPVSFNAPESYTNYMPEPLRNGMTLGELAQYMRIEHPGACSQPAKLTVIPMQNWHRDEFFDKTGVPWVNPSPNLRSVTEAVLYPGVGMMDATNMSVGRGTAMPFEVFGAGLTAATKNASEVPAWFDGNAVAAYLTARHIPGVTFAATTFSVAEDANKYPYHGQTIQGVRMTVTDRTALDSPELGIEILSALHHLYPAQFKLDKAAPLLANAETMAALEHGDDPRKIAAGWAAELEKFKQRREKYLIYQ